MNLQASYVSWVDLLVLIVLFLGIRRGMKRGMSDEVLFLGQWVVILFVGALGYALLGELLAQTGFVGLLWANLIAYLALALVVRFAFSGLRKSVGEKLLQGEVFGRGEYYLGMMAGGVRYLCVVLVLFSLLHAREFTSQDRTAGKTFQEVNFGSVLFPTLVDVQDEVFTRSFTGQFAADYLSGVLIRPVTKNNTPGRTRRVHARERALQEVLENR